MIVAAAAENQGGVVDVEREIQIEIHLPVVRIGGAAAYHFGAREQNRGKRHGERRPGVHLDAAVSMVSTRGSGVFDTVGVKKPIVWLAGLFCQRRPFAWVGNPYAVVPTTCGRSCTAADYTVCGIIGFNRLLCVTQAYRDVSMRLSLPPRPRARSRQLTQCSAGTSLALELLLRGTHERHLYLGVILKGLLL